MKPYRELPAYLRFFDAAMIPFLVNDITNATSPLKLFEYMAGGKPVVVTPMEESQHYPGVLVADGAARLCRADCRSAGPAWRPGLSGADRQCGPPEYLAGARRRPAGCHANPRRALV